ncbi:hypothetical protein SDRG_07260 [Saprolegnia diclina VS20]|uniref:RIIa domain-containing protein n=1 Tax=Saprolegnia diclina (strain VS20) TaxID=1156394 RepID=T0QMJ2_SAPDV|nr:hypothetical protein SDRG_07260 [Saprolegnia diclina VS20]EQC35020.1 hypothetical protein SDRG_07260 [Saprolegnia diclina VS20]|eukprot:XP_008611304.1 hypothetical protein SDRG_07260 [Saprolegnia diclina VS20]
MTTAGRDAKDLLITTKRAIVTKVQTRHKANETFLQHDLENDYDYMVKTTDPIFADALEAIVQHKPEQVASYLADFMVGGEIDLMKFKRSQLQTQFYFDRKVRDVMSLAIGAVIQDRPTDVRAYLADFFQKRSNDY